LVRHALATAETPMMEALAAMGRIHPFLERAGMTAFHIPPDEHVARLLSAAEAVGLTPGDLAAVRPVKELLRGSGPEAVFLKRELERCIVKTLCPARRKRSGDPIVETCRRTARRYVYYLAERTKEQTDVIEE
jgi:hypothetical protein